MTVAHRLCRHDDQTGGSCHGIKTVDADAGPGERSRHAFTNTQLHVLANDSGSFGVDFGDDLAAGPDQIGGTPEQPNRVATDAEVAVGERRTVPAAFAGTVEKTSRRIATAPRSRVWRIASMDTSIPMVGMLRAVSAAASRPGPQPMSSVAPRHWSTKRRRSLPSASSRH